MADLIPAKQKRSEITQRKILESLNQALASKFFEHISIGELAEGAGVSVGTFYRRFKDKNALIPLLYQDFGAHLERWVTELETQHIAQKEQVFSFLIEQTIQFINKHKGVFRTLHIYARLYPGLVPENKMTERTKEFERIAIWLESQLFDDAVSAKQSTKVRVWLFMIVDTIIEKVLYDKLTPAMACPLDATDYGAFLSQCLIADYRETL